MAYVNCFIEAWNDTRRVSISGRSANDSGGCRINTATADGERDIRVSADVSGTVRAKDRRRGEDTRRVCFTVELPELSPHVEVVIGAHGERWRDLIAMGAMLCGIKAADQAVNGDAEGAKRTIDNVTSILEEMELAAKDFPDITLPGGMTLKHALACVEIVKRLREQEKQIGQAVTRV